MNEQELSGGNMGGAVRVGFTVRKPTKPQSATVRRLLAHVRDQGVTWVPEPLGTDEQDRDVWSFIPGDVVRDHPAWLWSTDILTTVARRLREWHDATASFQRHRDDVWWRPGKLPAEVICHVDFAPYNHVFKNREFVGAIDFDICCPGPRLWDLAYTAYRYVPLTPSVGEPVVDGSSWDRTEFSRAQIEERLHVFLDAYAGEFDASRFRYAASILLGYLPPRLLAMADWCEGQDNEALRRNGTMYRVHAAWIAAGARGAADVVELADP